IRFHSQYFWLVSLLRDISNNWLLIVHSAGADVAPVPSLVRPCFSTSINELPLCSRTAAVTLPCSFKPMDGRPTYENPRSWGTPQTRRAPDLEISIMRIILPLLRLRQNNTICPSASRMAAKPPDE